MVVIHSSLHSGLNGISGMVKGMGGHAGMHIGHWRREWAKLPWTTKTKQSWENEVLYMDGILSD